MSGVNSLHRWAIRYGLGGSPDGWLLVQSGKRFDLVAVDHDEDDDVLTVEQGEEKREIDDDLGRMRQLDGVPLGLVSDTDPHIGTTDGSRRSSAADDALPDGGFLDGDSTVSLDQITSEMTVESVQTPSGVAKIINPFRHRQSKPDLVDIRPNVRLFRSNGTPATPRKTAVNAVESERASGQTDMGEVKQGLLLLASFVTGALVTEYIAGSSGGGGVEVPLTLAFEQLLTIFTFLL